MHHHLWCSLNYWTFHCRLYSLCADLNILSRVSICYFLSDIRWLHCRNRSPFEVHGTCGPYMMLWVGIKWKEPKKMLMNGCKYCGRLWPAGVCRWSLRIKGYLVVCTRPRVSMSTAIILLRKPVRNIAGLLGDSGTERYVLWIFNVVLSCKDWRRLYPLGISQEFLWTRYLTFVNETMWCSRDMLWISTFPTFRQAFEPWWKLAMELGLLLMWPKVQ